MFLSALVALLTAACSRDSRSPAEPTASATVIPTVPPTLTPVPPSPTPAPARASITFSFDPATSDGDRALVRGGVTSAVAFLEEEADLYGIDAAVYMYVLPQRLIAAALAGGLHPPIPIEILAPRLQRTASEAVPGAIVIDPTSSLWVRQNDVNRFRVAAHEYFHVAQFDLMGPEVTAEFYATPIGQVRAEGPNWLFEGSAEYVSWKALEYAGLADIDRHLQLHPVARDVSLAELETPLGFSTSDLEGLLMPLHAVHLLTADSGPRPLVRYYRELGQGRGWREAFALAFQRTVEAFYQEFQRYQSR